MNIAIAFVAAGIVAVAPRGPLPGSELSVNEDEVFREAATTRVRPVASP